MNFGLGEAGAPEHGKKQHHSIVRQGVRGLPEVAGHDAVRRAYLPDGRRVIAKLELLARAR